MKKFWLLLSVGCLLTVAALYLHAADSSAPKVAVQVQDEWFTPVTLRLNGLQLDGFIYSGPGTFIVQNQQWVRVTKPVAKPIDPIEELTPKKQPPKSTK